MAKESQGQNRTIRITESEIRDMVRGSVKRILFEGQIYEPIAYGKQITLDNGVTTKSIVTLSDGAGRYDIGEDDSCYVIYQDRKAKGAMYIFPELFKALKNLPDLPLH